MTKQEIIDAFDVAWKLRQLVELVASEEARSEMISAAETIIGSVTDDDEALDIILLALKAEADPAQLRELIEEKPDPDEVDEPEPVEAKPEKKKRAYHGSHRWTVEEDAWIANHLNSARSREVAERFGVSEKAAYTRMTIVRDRLGK